MLAKKNVGLESLNQRSRKTLVWNHSIDLLSLLPHHASITRRNKRRLLATLSKNHISQKQKKRQHMSRGTVLETVVSVFSRKLPPCSKK